VGKSYFLLGSPFKLAQAATPSCIVGPAAAAVEPASGDKLKLICGHQPSDAQGADYGRRSRRPSRRISPERLTGSDGRGGRFHCGPITLEPALTRWAWA